MNLFSWWIFTKLSKSIEKEDEFTYQSNEEGVKASNGLII